VYIVGGLWDLRLCGQKRRHINTNANTINRIFNLAKTVPFRNQPKSPKLCPMLLKMTICNKTRTWHPLYPYPNPTRQSWCFYLEAGIYEMRKSHIASHRPCQQNPPSNTRTSYSLSCNYRILNIPAKRFHQPVFFRIFYSYLRCTLVCFSTFVNNDY
jgi:hypothetical protein